ncbi:MAG: mechanosensitive ion channel domain-containing protein [Pseudomonadota bacterium]
MENETTAIDAAESATAAGEAAATEAALTNLVVQLEKALAAAVGAAPGLLGALGDAFDTLPDGSLLTISAALLSAYAIERGIRYLLAQRPVDAIGEGFEARVIAGLRWLAGRLLMIALFAVLARLIGRMIVPPDEAAAQLGLAMLSAIMFTRGIAAFLEALAAPSAPKRRLMGFDDAAAARAAKGAQVLVVLLFVVSVLRAILGASVGTAPEADLAKLLLVVAMTVGGGWYFLAVRNDVAALMEPRDGSNVPGWVAFAARNWAYAFLALVVVDALIKAAAVLGLLGEAARASNGAGPVILTTVVVSLIVAGLTVWRKSLDAADASPWALGATVMLEGLAIIAAAILILGFWGIDPLAPNTDSGAARLIAAVLEACAVVVIGIALWRTVTSLLVDAEEAEEKGEADGGDGMGGEGSRIGTVLPILRGFTLVAIGVTTTLTALAALGINIGPLVASAGVVGLAVGFGAQKLVADVISGAFYLYEDAFRVGEYIVSGEGKGTVERISLRSVTLRHHNGPIYTIPFSSMGTIQNHSRDYVVMKFRFQVPEDTDVEMVRKLVKKAGAEMAEDPELEGKLLAPLKSQGAIGIEGRSFVIGCKFTARPGTQFIIRRKAYVVLQKALREKGIELFAPQLTLAAEELGKPSGP